MNMKTLRRIIGIVALVMWLVGVVSRVALGEDMLVWQIDYWALILAPMFTLAYSIMLAVHILKGKHWAIKTLGGVVSSFVVLICLLLMFVIGLFIKYKVMSYKDYLVYAELGDFADPSVYVLYKRDGLFYRKLYDIDSDGSLTHGFVLGDDNFNETRKIDFFIYDDLDLMKCEADVRTTSSENHIISFYRFTDGYRYDKCFNDSLNALVDNYNERN